MPLSHEITVESQRNYNGMFLWTFDFLAAKQSEIETAAAFTGALADYWVARSRLDAALAGGMTFIGWRIARGVKARDRANPAAH
jgi:hypothetical protein